MKKFIETIKEIIEDSLDNSNFLSILSTLILIPLIYFGISTVFFKDSKLSTDKTESFKLIFIIFSVLVSILPILIRFLNNDKTRKNRYYDELNYFERKRDEREISKSIADEFNRMLNSKPDLLNVENIVYEKVTKNLEKGIVSNLEEKFKKNIEDDFVLNKVNEVLTPITKNTEIYIDRIQRNSIVNLVIGIIGTISAISILAFAIISDKSFVTVQDFLMHFLPRFTFVVFIQLFAFFFLRLYKNNLEDAKYFQNELSNLTAKSVSLKISLLTKNYDTAKEILKDISSTERNFKLLKDETLYNLENKKIEKEMDENVLNQLKDLVSKIDIKK